MFALNQLSRLVKKRKRIGRGGSRGGTSGKGGKGQNARSGGGVRLGFEGGQMPLHRRLPKRGFNNTRHQFMVKIVNLATLDQMFAADDIVTAELLCQKNIIKVKKGKKFLLKILGDGNLEKKLIVHADAFSASAKLSIEKLGGTTHLISKGE
jgi:large subunit ribosomal protein L15